MIVWLCRECRFAITQKIIHLIYNLINDNYGTGNYLDNVAFPIEWFTFDFQMIHNSYAILIEWTR